MEQLRAVRFAEPPVLDGDLSDPCWQRAPAITNFLEHETGGPPSEPTTMWLGYDGHYVYWAVHARDSVPSQICAVQKKRGGDLWSDDRVTLSLDTYRSHQEAYRFTFNPCGTQTEEIPAGAADKTEWRGDWEVVAKIVSDGWVGEARIPLRILRYPPGADAFCVMATRRIARLQEMVAWPYEGFVRAERQAVWGPLELPKPRPRFTTMLHAVPQWREGSTALSVGVDSRVVMPSGMTGLLSVNPDFEDVAQEVESIDFTYTERRLDDARPFFVEGRGFYPDDNVFYSRRLEDMDVGLKYFGRVGNDRVGVLDAWTPGSRHTMVGNWVHEFTTRSNATLVAVLDDNEGETSGQFGAEVTLGTTVGEKGGKNVSAELFTTTVPGQPGSRQRWSVGGYYGPPSGQSGIWANYGRVDEGFAPTTAYFPENGFTRWNVGLWANREFRTGRLRSYYFEGGLNWRDRLDGSTFDHELWSWAGCELRSHWSFGLSASRNDRPPYKDHTEGMYVSWNTDDIYRGGNASATIGKRAGGDYRYIEVGQGFRLSERWALRANASWFSLDLPTGPISNRQLIVTATCELDPENTFSARLVDNTEGSNVYASYRRKVRQGMDLYIIAGDPNAEETTERLATKAVWAF
ncbi:MAG: carbohydrate binding family 9 domain-containing protein [Armatimonadetes bacterium]|nr:carbohydrate binding family 9 domain-containing protein [Armatimonadota bacterium]